MQKTYKYDTHIHTYPVSKCGKASVRETLEFYASEGYDGIFITNHFIDGNINIPKTASSEEMPYRDKIEFYFSDLEEAHSLEKEYGIKVFDGVEMSNGGTDFLVYGLGKEWYLSHPEIADMKKSVQLPYLREAGAFIVQAHPFREANYIDHIRLYPRCVDAVETLNSRRTEEENAIAVLYAKHYGLPVTAGSDNHSAKDTPVIAGIITKKPICRIRDYADIVLSGDFEMFFEDRKEKLSES